MIVPIMTATTRDLFRQVPTLPKEGGEALGMTDWEVGSRITFPWVRSGIIGATALGLGRAIGETIAIAMSTGSIFHVAPNVYSPMSTIAALIVTQLDSAFTDGTGFAVSTLAEVALVLAVLSVLVNLAARLDRAAGALGAAAVVGADGMTTHCPGPRRRTVDSSCSAAGTYLALALVHRPRRLAVGRGRWPGPSPLELERAVDPDQGDDRRAVQRRSSAPWS